MLKMVNNLLKGIILVLLIQVLRSIIPVILPLNFFTVAIAAVLGLPGVIALSIIATILPIF